MEMFGRKLFAMFFLSFLFSTVQGQEQRLQSIEQENRQLKNWLKRIEQNLGAQTYTSKQDHALLPSYRGRQFKLGGELEFEYIDTENGTGVKKPYGYTKIDKFTLLPSARISDDITLEALLIFKMGSPKSPLSEAYTIFSNLAYDSKLTVGLDDSFINEWPSRKTESFALIDTAFARDDSLGLVWESTKNPLFWHMSLTNGYELGKSAVSEDASYKILHDNRQESEVNSNKQLGVGLGYRLDLGARRSLAIMGFGFQSELYNGDIATLQAISGYGASTDITQSRHGVAIDYKGQSSVLGAKWISAQDGVLKRSGWYLQSGYRIKLSASSWFRSITPFVRYGVLDVDLANDPADNLTWNRNMTTLALLADVTKGVKLKAEYYLNGEETGGAEIDNNEFMLQLEVKF
ncbi:MAG: hypothetical protein HUJ30_03560 [Gammaproteobacteria bacterium]|nr:hypothetical protein [Gammaproteobacteria bacterium]